MVIKVNLDIYRTAFLEVEKISSVKSHIEKLKYQQCDNNIKCDMNIDMSYRDVEFNECFISIPYKFELEIDADLDVFDIKINKLFVYVIEAKGINVEFELSVLYNEESKPIEIIDEVVVIEDSNEEIIIEEENENIKTEEEISEEIKLEQNIKEEDTKSEIEKVKEEISKDYEAKLKENLASRDDNNVKIISTNDKKSEVDFIRLFNSSEEKYRVKTLLCESEDELNDISKKYKVSINDLLKGYDKLSKRVIFKISTTASN